jgi:hypothetical protein
MSNEEELRWLLRSFERPGLGTILSEIYPRYYVQVGPLRYWFANYPPAERFADILTDLHRDQPQYFPSSPMVFARDAKEAPVRPIVWWDLKVRQTMHARFGYFKPQTRARVVSNKLPG